MKKQIKISRHLTLSLSLILAGSLFAGCQKASDDKPPTQPVGLIAVKKQAATVVCSSQMLKLYNQFVENKTKANEVNDNLQIDKTNQELTLTYKNLNLKQAETCKSLSAQFITDKTSSCLKSETEKTIANSVYKSTVESFCQPILDWSKKMTLPKGSTPSEKKEAALVLNFKESSQSLIQLKDSSDFTYLSNQSIKKGLDQFQKDILNGATTCAFQTTAEASLKENQFSTISEMPGSVFELGFEFKGSRFSLALEDSQKMMLGMTCYNMTVGAEASKKDLLQKAFGDLISVSSKIMVQTAPTENEKKDFELSKEVPVEAPFAETQISGKTAETTLTTTEKQKKSNEAIDDVIAKAKVSIHDVVKDAMVEVKATTDQARTETVTEVKKAAQEVSDETIAKAAVAAKEVSKVIIQDAKVAANEVVSQSVTTVKKAAVDSVKAPFVYVAKKAVEIKDAVVETTKKAVNYVEDKAIEVKNFLSNSVKSKDYWTTFFASKGQ
ncbi:MAG: hypothetical protein H7256_06480 [Bdellovibrio sp.]|nr:hypothetical protein [Bdellovibrio sp.]